MNYPHAEEGKRFKELITEKKISMVELSYLSGLSMSRLYVFTTGEASMRNLVVHRAHRLAKVLGFNTLLELYEYMHIDLEKE